MQAIPSEFLAIDRKSRAQFPSLDLEYRSVEERICDFEDVIIPLDPEWAMAEATRCIHCPDPAPCRESLSGWQRYLPGVMAH